MSDVAVIHAQQELAGRPRAGRPTRLQRRYWHLGTLVWVIYLFFDLPTVLRASASGARSTVQLALLAALVGAYLYWPRSSAPTCM